MKTTRVMLGSFFAVAALSAGLPLGAQTIQFITINRAQQMVQTDATTTSADPTVPFTFSAEVDGNSMTASSPLTAASVTFPNSTMQSLTAPNINNSQWKYNAGSYSSLGNLVTAFPSSTYTMSLTGDATHSSYTGTANITLTDPTVSLVATPLLTLTGGAGDGWSGGVYHLDPSHSLTITFNQVFTGSPVAHQGYHYDAAVFGSTNTSAIAQPSGFLHWDPTANAGAGAVAANTAPSFTISAGQLGYGGTYTLESHFDDIQAFTLGALGANAAAGLFEIRTQLTIQTAVPEPSTYAAIFGVVALASVMIRRRRRAAA
ncbi:PEP-CTERM sorting domain-containing protein [Opitutus sp. GAS368]|uniref:PEP-CTERM sorting domain-containing protein n=1 Tax=Opitutus sp. GAS368 TaxID=1882749 RepID=UPI000B84DB16|nr:PEP-CTERM sorting domain-containing protein [Opitutus sp. GAS368]